MIANPIRGTDFKGIFDYHDKKIKEGKAYELGRSESIDSNYLSEKNTLVTHFTQTIEDYKIINQTRGRTLERATFHPFISFANEDNPKLTDTFMMTIAHEYMDKMGYANCDYIVYKHEDRKHTHMHIVSSVIDRDGQKINRDYEVLKSIDICREIEEKYNLLDATKCVTNLEKEHKIHEEELMKICSGKKNEVSLNYEYACSLIVNKAIQETLKKPNIYSFDDYKQSLKEHKVELCPIEKEAKVIGLKYKIKNENKFSITASKTIKKATRRVLDKQFAINIERKHNEVKTAIDASIKLISNDQIKPSNALELLKEELEKRDIKTTFHSNTNGIYGISFDKDGLTIKASDLNQGKDKSYSTKSLVNKIIGPNPPKGNEISRKDLGEKANQTKDDYHTIKAIIIKGIDKTISEIKLQGKVEFNLKDFVFELEKEGVKTNLNYYNKTISGIVFEKNGLKFNGSELGGNYSLNKIKNRIEEQNTKPLLKENSKVFKTENAQEKRVDGLVKSLIQNAIKHTLEKNIYDFDSFEQRLSCQHNIKIKHDKKQNKIYFITPKNQKIEGESIGFGLKNLTYFIENKKEEKDNLLQENNSLSKNFTSFLLSMSSLDSKREEQAKNGLYKVMESVILQGITKFEEAKKEFEKHGIELYKDSEKQENRIKDINLRVDFSEDSIREPLEKFHLDLAQNQKNKDEKNQTAGREILKSIDFALESGAESFPELQRKLKEEDIEFKYSPEHVSTPDFLQFSKNNESFSYGIILTSKWTGKELKERFDANVRKREFTESIRECLKEKSLIGFKTALSKNEIRVKLDDDPVTNKPCITFEKGDMTVKSPELKQEAEVQNIINQIVEEKKLKQAYNQTKKEIATVIDKTIQQSSLKDSTIESLSNELKKENINTSFTYYNKTVSGITFEKENIKLKGSELGNNYSINKLKERIEGQNKQVLEAHKNLRNWINQAIKIVKEKDLPTLDEKLIVFEKFFKEVKVELTFHKNVKGIYGLSFRKDGLTIKASELNQGKHKSYSAKNIIEALSKPEKKTEQPTGVKEIVRPTGGDYKTNKAFVISVIDKAINQSSKINLDLDLLLKQLQKEGIKADFTYYNNTVSGIIFKKDEFKFNGSELGKDYSINKINDRIESQNTRILKSYDRLRVLTDNVIKLVASVNPPSLNAKMDLFVSEFKKLELNATFHSNASGVYGLSFEKNGITIKASELNQGKDKSYSAKNIIEALCSVSELLKDIKEPKEILNLDIPKRVKAKEYTKAVIDKALFDDRIYTLGDFIERLRKEDVRVIISGITSYGVFELSYQAHGEAFKGLEIESNKGNYSDAKVRKFLDNNSPVIKLQKSCDSLNLNVKAKGIVVQLNCLGIEVEGENLRFKEVVAPIDKVFNKDISEKISGHPNDDLYLNHSSKEEKRMTINLFDLLDDDKVWLRGNKLVSDCFKMIERGVNVYLPEEYRKEGIVESICLLSENRESHHQTFPEPPRGSFLLQQFFKGLLSDIAVSNVPIKNKKKGDWDDEDENTRSYGGFSL